MDDRTNTIAGWVLGAGIVALGASIGGRPHHRIGDRYQDLKDLGDTTNA